MAPLTHSFASPVVRSYEAPTNFQPPSRAVCRRLGIFGRRLEIFDKISRLVKWTCNWAFSTHRCTPALPFCPVIEKWPVLAFVIHPTKHGHGATNVQWSPFAVKKLDKTVGISGKFVRAASYPIGPWSKSNSTGVPFDFSVFNFLDTKGEIERKEGNSSWNLLK